MTTHSIRHFKKFSLSVCLAIAFPVAPAERLDLGLPASKMTGLNVDKTESRASTPTIIQGSSFAPIQKVKSDDAAVPEIEMFVGESRVFPTPGVGRIAVGNGGILTAAALDKKEVILFANAPGTSTLFIWNEDGRYQRLKVIITAGDTTRYARDISSFLRGIAGTKTSIIGDKVIVEGDNLADSDIAKIDELAKRYPQIVNFTNRLGWEPMILMDVKVVEFPVNELREIGIRWNATGGASFGGIWAPVTRKSPSEYSINVPGGPVASAVNGASLVYPTYLKGISAVNAGAEGKLNLLAQSGKATLLAEPQLSARSGSKASFLAGGEYPYSVSTINGPTVIFKPYGIKLDITPRVDRNGVVRAVIESEVSSIDGSVTTLAGPALSTRKTSTEFNVQAGETLVLSGLISRKNSNSIDKIPGLGDIPILGALFRSKRFQNDETELVVFVTPTIVDSQTPKLVERIQRAQERLQNNLGSASYLTDPLQPQPEPTPEPEPVPQPDLQQQLLLQPQPQPEPVSRPVIQDVLPPPKDEEE